VLKEVEEALKGEDLSPQVEAAVGKLLNRVEPSNRACSRKCSG
jgi:hypothetical protein